MFCFRFVLAKLFQGLPFQIESNEQQMSQEYYCFLFHTKNVFFFF